MNVMMAMSLLIINLNSICLGGSKSPSSASSEACKKVNQLCMLQPTPPNSPDKTSDSPIPQPSQQGVLTHQTGEETSIANSSFSSTSSTSSERKSKPYALSTQSSSSYEGSDDEDDYVTDFSEVPMPAQGGVARPVKTQKSFNVWRKSTTAQTIDRFAEGKLDPNDPADRAKIYKALQTLAKRDNPEQLVPFLMELHAKEVTGIDPNTMAMAYRCVYEYQRKIELDVKAANAASEERVQGLGAAAKQELQESQRRIETYILKEKADLEQRLIALGWDVKKARDERILYQKPEIEKIQSLKRARVIAHELSEGLHKCGDELLQGYISDTDAKRSYDSEYVRKKVGMHDADRRNSEVEKEIAALHDQVEKGFVFPKKGVPF